MSRSLAERVLRLASIVVFTAAAAPFDAAAEPLTRSCNTNYQAPDLMVRFSGDATGAVLSVVANPSLDPDLYERLRRPKSGRFLAADWVVFDYDFDWLVNTDEVAAQMLSDPVLMTKGIAQVVPDHFFCGFPERPPPGRVTVTEYHNRILDHYFLSSSSRENDAIDAGAAGSGWERTGESFTASLASGCTDASPVFRFYGAGPNSHFFTVDPQECGLLHNADPGWQFEANAFGARLPVNGACDAGWRPLFRLYNNRFAFNDSNHRYVVRRDLYDQMMAKGWLGEGVAMCLPIQ